MQKVQKNIAIIYLISNCLFVSHARSEQTKELHYKDFFNESEKHTVIKGEIITKAFLKNEGAAHTVNTGKSIILPDNDFIRNISNSEMLCVEKCFFSFKLTDKSISTFYNLLASASGLAGMKYYSISDKKVHTLITQSSAISPPGEKRPLKKTIHEIIRPELIQYFEITDNRFGNLKFRSILYNNGDNFILKNICIQPMKKYLATINREEEYQLISFFIYDKKAGGYFCYSVNAMRIRSSTILNLGMLKPESFGNRIRAYTVYFAELLGLDWKDRLTAFE